MTSSSTAIDIAAAISAGHTCSVPYHVESYGPGRTCHSWGAPEIGEAAGPEGWLRVGLHAGSLVIDEDDEEICPPELWGASADGPGMVIVETQ